MYSYTTTPPIQQFHAGLMIAETTSVQVRDRYNVQTSTEASVTVAVPGPFSFQGKP